MTRGVVAVDQDYVLASLLEKWLDYYNAVFNDNLKVENIKDWSVSKLATLTKKLPPQNPLGFRW